MKRNPTQRKFSSMVLNAALFCGATFFGPAAAVAQTATPLPKAMLEAASPQSPSLMSADRYLRPQDLAAVGYVEQEYLISGAANVYDWDANGKLAVKTANAPYGSRIRVRRPKDPAKFSGTVVVELPNAARRFDWDMMWGYLSDEIIARGDGWVAITPPPATPGLKVFDPIRYKDVSFANPAPGDCPNGAAAPPIEEGLRWDMYSQVGALIKNNAAGMPFGGFPVQAIYMTTQGGDVVTYMNVFHLQAKLASGKFVYDGFLSKQPNGVGRLNACGTAPPKGDSRNQIHNVGVPVIAVIAQGEVIGSMAARRADSDDAGDKFRLYEVSGGSHLDQFNYYPFASMSDAARAGNAQGTPEFPFAARCTPEIQLIQYPLMPFVYHAALNHLDNWAKKGIAPPHADRIQVKDPDTKPTVAMDQFGNALGGVRTFWVDVPAVNFAQSSTGPGNCPELGHSNALAWQKLEAMYGDYKSYIAKASASIDKSVKDGWLTQADATRIKAEMAAGGN